MTLSAFLTFLAFFSAVLASVPVLSFTKVHFGWLAMALFFASFLVR